MVTGALAAQAAAPEEHRFTFALIGAGAAVVQDIDFLARKAKQRLLFLKLHRGFTHSLVALPLIAACAAGSGVLLFGTPFWRLFLASAAAALTHIALDTIMHSTGLRVFWPSREKLSLHLVVGLNPLTSSARCGERSLGVCLRCTMHSAVLSPLVLMLWTGFVVSLLLPWWRAVSAVILGLALLYLLFCRWARARARRALIRRLRGRSPPADPRRVEVFPGSFNPCVWIGISPVAEGYEVIRVNAVGGRTQTINQYGPSAMGPVVDATEGTETVSEFLSQAVFPHATLIPAGSESLVVWRDLAFAFSPAVSLFAARVELDQGLAVKAEEFRERWDHPPDLLEKQTM